MFGRKKKDESVMIKPDFSQDNIEGDIISQAFNQPPQYIPPIQPQPIQQFPQPQQFPQQFQQPVQPIQQFPQQFQQPVQPIQQFPQPQQFQPMARIIRAESSESGDYLYVVEANYPLQIGNCILKQ